MLSTRYERLLGRPLPVALALLEEALQQHGDVQGLCVTGTGAKLIAGLLQVPFVNEVVAQSRAAAHLHPQARTIIEIGGDDSKLISWAREPDGVARRGLRHERDVRGRHRLLPRPAGRAPGVSIEEFGEPGPATARTRRASPAAAASSPRAT